MSGRITEKFRELVEYRWSEFVTLDTDVNGSNFDSIVGALVRACKKGNLRAIQVALDRLDGKIATEIEVEYPKFYTVYPQATKTADDAGIIELLPEPTEVKLREVTVEEEPLTGSLRDSLGKMLDAPKGTVNDILAAADAVEAGDKQYGDPFVKGVIVAGLMKLVHDGRVSAVFEVFDQIDGKVADKIKILGDDVNVFNYALIAPAGAERNADGFYQIANDNVTNSWVTRLEEKNGR